MVPSPTISAYRKPATGGLPLSAASRRLLENILKEKEGHADKLNELFIS